MGQEHLEWVTREAQQTRSVVDGLKHTMNIDRLERLVFRKLELLRPNSHWPDDALLHIIDLVWKDYTSEDALAALEAIVERDTQR